MIVLLALLSLILYNSGVSKISMIPIKRFILNFTNLFLLDFSKSILFLKLSDVESI